MNKFCVVEVKNMITVANHKIARSAAIELYWDKLQYRNAKRKKIKYKEITKKLLKCPVRTIPSLTEELGKRIEQGIPTLMARLGGTEGRVAGEFIERRLHMQKHYSPSLIQWLYTTSGFFADDYSDREKAMDEYAELTLAGLADCDYLSAMFPERDYMPFLFKHFTTNTTPTFSDYGPYFDTPTEKTWVGALRGKKVLVVNSFTDSIEKQYKRKSELVRSKEFELPDFELVTYKTFVTQVGERPGGFRNSFEVLEKMISDIRQIDFDVALVGAGAYGFPISVEIKRMGKIAMETCGHTPVFFGVYGERELRQGLEKNMTDAWIRPIESAPKRYKEVEGGCYW